VSAEKVDMMKSQQQQLDNPHFIFYDTNQQEMAEVTGKHCNISKDFNQITVIDDTLVKSKSGMQVTAHMIKYDSKKDQFSTPGVANFKWEKVRGKSKGFVYNTKTEELDLLEDPEVTYIKVDDEEGRVPIVLTGDTGMVDHKTGFAFFEGNVIATQENNK